MKNTLLIVLASIILIGCGPGKPDGFRISGKLENGAGITIYLDELTTTSTLPVSSVIADADGNFELTGMIEQTGFYKIRLAENNFVNIVLGTEDDITITGDATYLYGSYKVKGSRDAIALFELNEYLRIFGVKMDSIQQVAATNTGSPQSASINNSLRNYYTSMNAEKLDFLRNFVDQNTSSLASLAAIEGLDPSADADYFIKLDKQLNELYPSSPYVKNFHVRVVQMSRLAVGSEAPQILLNNPDGETVSLSSLRGKIVLIDFWASWCKPCRRENPNVVKVYNKYKDQGFEIYGVSLDRQMGAWVQAIQQDGLEWIHVSDLQFWNSAPVKLYDVNSIPQTYLIDREGKIIGKGLRAEALEKMLEEIFG